MENSIKTKDLKIKGNRGTNMKNDKIQIHILEVVESTVRIDSYGLYMLLAVVN